MKELLRSKKIWLGAGVVVVLGGIAALFSSAFIVRPHQFAIVTEFGEPVDIIKTPGLYWKAPFVQDVRYLDNRVRGWDDDAEDIKTIELRTIDIEVFARWRIDDPLIYYTRLRDERRAHASMDSVVTAQIQSTVRERKLASIVRNEGRSFSKREEMNLINLIAGYEECTDPRNLEVQAILAERREEERAPEEAPALRSRIVDAIINASNKALRADFGIEILDLHFKYLNYSKQVHAKMISAIEADRRKDIASYRKIGKACSGSIDRLREQRLGQIEGERDQTVREIEGRAVAEAIEIKARAFDQDPEFFSFIRTLELFEGSFDSGTRMVLASDNPLLRLMQDPALLAAVKRRGLPPVDVEQILPDLSSEGAKPTPEPPTPEPEPTPAPAPPDEPDPGGE
jgi:membrane protease subunit HflC